MTTHKSARQYSDQMVCSHCGKSWDVNDPDPPECEVPLWSIDTRERVADHRIEIDKLSPADRIAQLRGLFKNK